MVPLEDLASVFNMTTDTVISSIKNLEATEALSGVLDDRGKYIYLTEGELHNIVQFLTKKGRVTKAELAKECNR